MWFSCDGDGGVEEHDTAEEARQSAQQCLAMRLVPTNDDEGVSF